MTNPTRPRRVVVLASGAGSTLRAVLEAAADEAYGARVVAVITDQDDAGALEIAHAAGLATAVVKMADFPDRATWDQALARAIGSFDPDLVLLAGFMRIVGAPSLERFGGRMVNTHPALLPAYPGAHAVRDALAGGAKVTGCTVIIVDAGVDTGPIVAQAPVEVAADDDEATLHERIKTVERRLVADTVGRMAREGWTVSGRTVRIGTPTSQEDS
ncbi:phosphoribosylglycinamide formyltransferase [Demequina sp. SYSU T00039]|uniref:Phosphoribosylglycinamide formyltransferase n=1 Tax=Demequina lignilytica TaxID=3051663 RepID=A0AAW7M924_9MICO|nr:MULTISPECIES: phosphoribosylglycinamide formyltransferase [unclassified Demequina]MDN4478195.1 phosphoribosylglycinamide formyltransferase [Demequina sp. SYSU T00039-1]MDN4488355.1 phosphoribosylglycinamide formyltransferase [Demequina sp. SYSU T00039]MDN4490098.1 phosphoribosylglycinamide formyltransferase [Demequina sp. SYSU T00068]